MDKLAIRQDAENETVELIYGANPPLVVHQESWKAFVDEIQNDRFNTEPTSLRDEVGVPKDSDKDETKTKRKK